MGGTLDQMQQALPETGFSGGAGAPLPPGNYPDAVPMGFGASAIGSADTTYEDGSNAMTGSTGITDTGWTMPGAAGGAVPSSLFGNKSFMSAGSQYPAQGGASIGAPFNPGDAVQSLVSRGMAGAQQSAAAKPPVTRQTKGVAYKKAAPKPVAPGTARNTADMARSNANKSSPLRGSTARQKGR